MEAVQKKQAKKSKRAKRSKGNLKIEATLKDLEIHPVTEFREKVAAVMSILTAAERKALLKLIEGSDRKVSTPVGNERIVLLLIKSLWMRETEEGKGFAKEIQQKVQKPNPEYQGNVERLQRHLPQIKRWMDGCTFREKLTAILCQQLISKESLFKSPNENIGSRYFKRFKSEITSAQKSKEYRAAAEKEEAFMADIIIELSGWFA